MERTIANSLGRTLVKALLLDHGMQLAVAPESGKTLVLDILCDAYHQVSGQWVDCTEWTAQDARMWLGY